MEITYSPLGEEAIVLEVGQEITKEATNLVRSITRRIEQASIDSVVEVIPAFTTVTVFYRVSADNQFEDMKDCLTKILHNNNDSEKVDQRTIEIPVCYGGEHGPDLEFVASHNQLKVEEVIAIHSSGTYEVNMIGFAPGFPFIGGMSEKIAAPRRSTPRLRIPERSVGIAGMQTGVYPIETPGGWQLIGRTPMDLFLPHEDVPSLLQAGDLIVFKPITESEYAEWEGTTHADD
ncbi:5-oxoprolinase subunit PxpB [Paenisporosarcina sp. FSL H8-0542]|uniref:5-oxoprolinase subunit PxpB n=1 Tax=unclassified Paenisporosarcina TaxID=2642018 RepID=UPI00034EC9DB|nr:5-oxoprolinase subunit PxpB [Paenisporosarcina sp. HGH0030]EPD51446.1 TIGR00370 family protein [Paenisporosarcina sp. HGH0030]